MQDAVDLLGDGKVLKKALGLTESDAAEPAVCCTCLEQLSPRQVGSSI